jgi:hypothetical protein
MIKLHGVCLDSSRVWIPEFSVADPEGVRGSSENNYQNIAKIRVKITHFEIGTHL